MVLGTHRMSLLQRWFQPKDSGNMLDSPLLFEDYINYVDHRRRHLPKKTGSRGLQTIMAPVVDILGQDAAAVRKGSLQPSTRSNNETIGSDKDICRICHCEGDMQLPLISPCFCSGSLKYVHQACLQQWIKSSDTKCCELCKFEFIMNTKVKPFTKWERLDLSAIEQRKVFCSITFHLVAITCVVWSLYVLIDRTSEEMKDGRLDWPFWTKLIVLAVGFTGGAVFMYVQCRMYFQLFKRWKAFNRIIFVQDAPSKDKDLPTAHDLMPVNILIQDDQTKASPENTSCISPLSEQNVKAGRLATVASEDNC